jgi:hypothetical protein
MALVGGAAGLGVTVGHRLELVPQRRVSPHDWKDTSNGFPHGPADAHGAARRRRHARRTCELNQIIRADAPAAGLRIADAWAHTGPPWQGKYAADDFHPNDTGYGEWCAAFADAVGLDGS